MKKYTGHLKFKTADIFKMAAILAYNRILYSRVHMYSSGTSFPELIFVYFC